MIIPIRIESPETQPEKKVETRIVPIILSPQSSLDQRNNKGVLGLGLRDSAFGDILLPALSKYFQLRDSKTKDFESLLAKENPLKIESFKKTDDKYELQINVQKFKPEELHVKITDDWISILGEHEEKADRNNYTKQEFLRRYSLPNRVKASDIKCELSSDGYLLISAPTMEESVKITEIPLTHVESKSGKTI